MIKLVLIFFTFCFFVSCKTSNYIVTEEGKNLKNEKTKFNEIKVYSFTPKGKDYIVLGQVIATKDGTGDVQDCITLLQKKASSLKANAIINLRLEFKEGGWDTATQASGTAVFIK